jgi:4-hydroxybenzoate polyprenyltransferase/phosphoserine phosphatase
MKPSADPVPLCVDLDGALLPVDTLQESLVRFLKRHPWQAWRILSWLAQGQAAFKQQLAVAAPLDFSKLPVTEDFLKFLHEQQARGRRLVLVTGADFSTAQRAAEHFGIFSEVIASDGRVNLTGHLRRTRLVEKFGEGKFDYAGNSKADLPVWRAARQSIFVNAPAGVQKRLSGNQPTELVFGETTGRLATWRRALRLHQWAKNFLVFVPIIVGHKLKDWPALGDAALGMVAFCACASSVYLINDLEDLESDRVHPTKRRRPFASGQLPPVAGLVAAPLLLLAGVVCGWFLPPMFLVYVAVYYVTSILYSQVIKKLVLLDVFVLAGLYMLRILAGLAATGIRYSSWLLGFSMFLFLSLALLKRYIELHRLNLDGGNAAKGRGYVTGDMPLLLSLGLASGGLATLVLALYVNSDDVRLLYEHSLRLLLICPLLLYWISRVWLLATRNELHDDPVFFAMKDRTSYVVGALTAFFIWLGSI